MVFTNVSREARVDGQSDKGDCYAALGEGCVRDYMVGIAEGLLRQVGNGVGDGELVVPEPPGSCGVRISGESLIYRKLKFYLPVILSLSINMLFFSFLFFSLSLFFFGYMWRI